MVNFRPLTIGLFSTPSKWPKNLHGLKTWGGPILTTKWVPILQVSNYQQNIHSWATQKKPYTGCLIVISWFMIIPPHNWVEFIPYIQPFHQPGALLFLAVRSVQLRLASREWSNFHSLQHLYLAHLLFSPPELGDPGGWDPMGYRGTSPVGMVEPKPVVKSWD